MYLRPVRRGRLARGGELLQRRERRLVGEIILARLHHAHAERPAVARHRRRGHEPDFGIVEDGRRALDRLWPADKPSRTPRLSRIGIVDVAQCRARLDQPVALAVDVAVIERDGGEAKLAGRLTTGAGLPCGA
jgi:hypothetical protein